MYDVNAIRASLKLFSWAANYGCFFQKILPKVSSLGILFSQMNHKNGRFTRDIRFPELTCYQNYKNLESYIFSNKIIPSDNVKQNLLYGSLLISWLKLRNSLKTNLKNNLCGWRLEEGWRLLGCSFSRTKNVFLYLTFFFNLK